MIEKSRNESVASIKGKNRKPVKGDRVSSNQVGAPREASARRRIRLSAEPIAAVDASASPLLAEAATTERHQLRQLLMVVKAVRRGDFSVRMPTGPDGIVAEVAEVLNDIIELNDGMAHEFARVWNTVGQEGRMNERVSMGSVKGGYANTQLRELMGLGSLDVAANGEMHYVLSARPGVQEIINSLSELYAAKRNSIISFIYSQPLEKIHDLADAFMFRKE